MLSPYFGGRVASLIGLWRRKKKEKTTRLNICVAEAAAERRPQATVVGVEAMLPNLSRWNFLCCSTLRDNFSSFGWLPEVRKSAASDNNASILCVHKSGWRKFHHSTFDRGIFHHSTFDRRNLDHRTLYHRNFHHRNFHHRNFHHGHLTTDISQPDFLSIGIFTTGHFATLLGGIFATGHFAVLLGGIFTTGHLIVGHSSFRLAKKFCQPYPRC